MHSHAQYQPSTGVRLRTRAFDALQPAAALSAYVTALDVTAEAVMIVDRSGVLVYANGAAESVFDLGSLTGRPLLSLYSLDQRVLRTVLKALRKKNVWHGNLPLRTLHAPLEMAVVLRTVALVPGRTQHFCLIADPHPAQAHDQANSTLLSTVGRVAGEIAHDFNNQIAVVINYSFILMRQLPEDSPLRAHVAEMQSAAWRASQVAQEMLGFSGQRSAEADEIDLNALLADVQALFAHALREETHLEQHLGRDLWRVRARRAHLEWLLVELASRMRATMGPIERFRIITCNASVPSDAAGNVSAPGGRAQSERAVLISIEALPHTAPLGIANAGTLPGSGHQAAPRFGMAPPTLRGTELALTHAQGELTVQQLPHGGLRYRIRLPAA